MSRVWRPQHIGVALRPGPDSNGIVGQRGRLTQKAHTAVPTHTEQGASVMVPATPDDDQRCRRCGFRYRFHEPANHPFAP